MVKELHMHRGLARLVQSLIVHAKFNHVTLAHKAPTTKLYFDINCKILKGGPISEWSTGRTDEHSFDMQFAMVH